MIADIAMVFHWSYSDLRQMRWDELQAWHSEAVERFKIQAKIAGAQIK